MTAAAGLLAGNLLSVADSDFETWTGDWTANSNCSVAQSSAQSFTGSHSMAITATASGSASVQSGFLPVSPGASVVVSDWLYASATHGASVYVNWFTSGQVYVSTSALNTVNVTAGTFSPLVNALTAPATTGLMKIIIQANTLAANEVVYADLVYAAPSLWQCLAAWPSNPLSTTPLYADMTPWLRADQGISVSRGRQDETSTVQAGSCSFTLDNSAPGGWFAPGNTNSPFTGVTVGKRIQLKAADETGTWHTRCTNFVTSITPSWTGGPGLESLVKVQAQDLLAWLSRDNELRTMIEEEMLLDGPECLYVLADPLGSTTASDSGGSAAPPLLVHKYPKSGSPGTLAFGASGGTIGAFAPGFSTSPINCASFTPSATTGGNIQLEGYLPSLVSASAGFTAEIFYKVVGTTFGANSITPFSLTNSRTGASVGFAYATVAGGGYLWYQPNPSGTLTTSSGVTLPVTADAVITVSGTTMTLYINDSSVQTLTVPAAFTADYLTVGGPFRGPFGTIAMSGSPIGWFGQLNCFGVYNSVLSGTRIGRHYTAGMQQNYGQLISTLVSNVLQYEGVPSSLQSIDSGASYADGYETTGQTPLSVIQLYQQTDGGVFYVNAAGQLAWQDRTARYAAQVTPALVLQAAQYEADLNFPVSTQFVVDDATFANYTIPGGVRSVNAAAVAANGTYPDGDPASPQTGPWYSYPFDYPTAAGGEIGNPDVLTDATQWEVNIYGNPVPRSPNLTIDLATQAAGTGSQVSRAGCYSVDVGSVIEIAALPASGPGGTRVNYLMTEGVTETFQRDGNGVTWTLQFNTSPASYSAAWIAGDANMGVLDSTAVVGRGTDGDPSGSTPATYVGPPYSVPAFSSSMNVTGNVGANDMRGLTYNTALQVSPPCAMGQQVSLAQSIPNTTNTVVQFDNVWYDTWNGFNLTSSATTYTVQVAGVYLLTGSAVFAGNATGVREAWFEHNGSIVGVAAEAQAIATATGVPATQQVLCAQGDTLQMWCLQTSGGALALSTASGGPVFSILWLGT